MKSFEDIKKNPNHENLAQSTGEEEPVEIEAVKMLLERIKTDIRACTFKRNFDSYPGIYKAMVEWLKIEAEK